MNFKIVSISTLPVKSTPPYITSSFGFVWSCYGFLSLSCCYCCVIYMLFSCIHKTKHKSIWM